MNARSQWYSKAFARDDSAATVYYEGIGDARGSIMVSLRQKWFETLGRDPVGLLAPLLERWHVSRVDLAADCTGDARLSPATLYERLPAARSRSRPANRTLTMAWDGAQKLTIGSRASDRYLRIYSKDVRTRHEVELKGQPARVAWGEMVAGRSLHDVWADEYGRVVQWR